MASLVVDIYCLALLFCLSCYYIEAKPEQGVRKLVMIPDSNKELSQYLAGLSKSMYENSLLTLEITCTPGLTFTLEWGMRSALCANEFIDYDDENFESLSRMFQSVDKPVGMKLIDQHWYIKSELKDKLQFTCPPNGTVELPNYSTRLWKPMTSSGEVSTDATPEGEEAEADQHRAPVPASPGQIKNLTAALSVDNATLSEKTKSRKRRGVDQPPAATTVKTTIVTSTKPLATTTPVSVPGAFVKIPSDGIYMFIILATYDDDTHGNITAVVRTFGHYGYLSVIDWPLLPFYGVMCAFYIIFLLGWVILCCCFWKDLLRIQYWIGAVILIGFVEEATFVGEYHVLNQTGQSVPGAVIFGELVSAGKRALSRMLVIIASVGFGIVKPRLGPTFPKVIAVGVVYFVLSSVEGFQRATTHKANQQGSNGLMILLIILAVTDAGICWWIFTSLVNTMRTLRIRRNLIKLSLYRHFTNTLIFSVIASLSFMIWSIIEHKRAQCLTDWKELWVDEAFWHLLFSIILLVIMVLWRPSANNQRYAYSPLADGGDDEAEEPMMNDAFEGMKMRGSKGDTTVTNRQSNDQTEEDLKWIEENIPTSVADSALPSLLDSEEEIMTAKYEMSKMQ